jgi:capsular exopolysaccharide synthesis family protein
VSPSGTHDTFERARAGENLISGLAVLRRRRLIVISLIIASVGVLVANHEHQAKSYAATANVAFQSGTLSDSALQISPSGSGEPQREANTEVLVAHSYEVAQAVARQLRIQGGAEALLEEVAVEAAPNADVLNIVATTASPRASAQLANAFAEQYIAFRGQSQLAGIASAQRKLQQQIAVLPAGDSSRQGLESSLQRLGELRAVAGGGANIIGRATIPTNPRGSGLRTSLIIGVLIGLALAFTVVFLLESLDRRVKSIDEFEREYRLSALAAIPNSAFRAPRAVERKELLEPYRILRSALDFAAVTRQMDTLLVTSAIGGEGKTTAAVDLAHTVALTGRSVVLMELDLRRPTFGTHFNISVGRGLTAALTGGVSPMELLIEPFPDLPHFSILPVGRIPYNPSELLGSPRITDIINKLASGKDIVIIDSAPLNPVADTQVLLNNSAIHAAIIVARLGVSTRDEVRAARAVLDRQMVEPVGIVVTGVRDVGMYGYAMTEAPPANSNGTIGVLSPDATVSASRQLRI